MEDSLIAVVLVAALCALAWTAVAYARYRALYRYDDEDLAAARRDAATRSRGVLAGKAAEQLAPLVPAFAERFDAAEARFIGAPVDYVVFDGLRGGALREVVLVEVKTAGGRLNANERQVLAAVREGRVSYEILRLE